jgi:tetratricopeptide (TPR) repeat protein
MELADDMGRGQEIDEASYAPRNLRSELHLRGRLPAAECLRIGLALTTALEHLHKHGLVHRDIKPSNIVFVNGLPKLADIGLVARADDSVSFVGTEGFLPPEGPGTRQADIFSLGKVLYELSTGHDRHQFPELPTNIAELPDRAELGELNEVLLKACHRDPTQRYQTAAEMHADLALLESGRSVVRLRTVERRLKFVARAGVAVTLLAAVALAAWFWQSKQTRRMRQLAEENRQVAQFLKDMLKGVGPSVALGRDTTLLREILDKTAAGVGPDLKDQPEIEAELRTTLGSVYREVGDTEKSEAMLRQALAIRQRLFGENLLVAESMLELSATLQAYVFRFETEAVYRSPPAALTAKLTEAESLARQALAMRRRLLGNEHVDVADALNELCNSLYHQFKLVEAEQSAREALALARKLLPDDHRVALESLNNLSMVLLDLGKLEEAEALCRELLPRERKRLGEIHPTLVSLLSNLGQTLDHQHKFAEAETFYREAVAMERKLNGNDSHDLAMYLCGLANVLQRQAKLVEAESLYREALALKVKMHGEQHIDVAAILDNIGNVLLDQGKLEDAESMLTQGLAMREKLLGKSHPHYSYSLANLAGLRDRQGNLPEAESLLRQAVEIEHSLASDGRSYIPELPGSSRIVMRLDELAYNLLRQGRPAEAETALREALDYLRKPTANGPPPETPILGKTIHHVAEMISRRKAFAEARPLAEEAVALYQRHPDWPSNERQHARGVLKDVLIGLGDFSASELICRERLQYLRDKVPPDSPELATALAELARALLAAQKFGEAEPFARECLEIRERTIPDDWRTFNGRSFLGGCLLGQKRYAEAEPLLLAAYEGIKQREDKIPPAGKLRPKECLQWLVQLYEETNRLDEAAKWKQKLAEFDQTGNK